MAGSSNAVALRSIVSRAEKLDVFGFEGRATLREWHVVIEVALFCGATEDASASVSLPHLEFDLSWDDASPRGRWLPSAGRAGCILYGDEAILEDLALAIVLEPRVD
jgi:hypothetical protein